MNTADPADTFLSQRTISRSKLAVSVLGFGAAPLGDLFERVPESRAQEVLARAYDAGIRFFDTAPWYGHGLSEHRVGHHLRQQPREDLVLSTKVGRIYSRPENPDTVSTAPWAGGLPFELRFDYSRDGILRSYEDSLQRLGVCRIDMLVIHDLDTQYHGDGDRLRDHRKALEQSGFAALEFLKSKNQVRAVGAGINDAAMMPYFLDRFDLDFFLVAMPYTLIEHARVLEFFEICRQRRISVVIGSPFASGILATGPRNGAYYNYAPAEPEVIDRTRRVESVCEEFGVPLPAAALQFPLAHPAVVSVIPGATVPEFIDMNIEALRYPIPADFWSTLREKRLIDRDAPAPDGNDYSIGTGMPREPK